MTDFFHSPLSSLRVLSLSLVVVVCAGVVLVSCQRQEEVVLPEGPQTMTGILVPLPISVTRRGTHALMQNGQSVYLVESSTVNLRHFEEVEAIVSGRLERNIDPEALPVLVASGVTLVDISLRTWTIPAFNLSLSVPPEWSPSFFPDGARFSQTGADVILSIHPSLQPTLPAGNTQQVAGYPGVIVTESGSQTLYLRRGGQILAFEYHPEAIPGLRSDLFLRILRSASFVAASSAGTAASSASVSGGTGSTLGAPCGGAAGILCPTGQFCEITDRASNIGRCRSLKQ